MSKLVRLLIIFLFVFIRSSSAQEDVKIKRKEFRIGKAGFKQAWDHVIAGDAAYIKKGFYYNNAFEHYIQAVTYNNSNAELNYKIGIAAIYTDRKEEAAGFFLKALETRNNVSEDILLYTGRALQYTGEYSEAIEKLTGYLKIKDKKSESNLILARKFIEECNAAIELTKDTVDIELSNLGANINSDRDDFAPVFTWDGQTIYFASERETAKSSTSPGMGGSDGNIYFSRIINGTWGMAEIAGDNLVTEYNESPLYIDSAETTLYVYSGYENGGDIMVSENRKGDWRKPESLPYSINSSRSETSIDFLPSGEEIYYVTDDGKDNMGGYDIYFIKKLTDRKWSKPQNAGPSINTSYDEMAISFSSSGDTLWFSSKGHNSMGGFDIFFSIRNQDGTWQPAINAGFPLNSVWDELFHSSPGSMPGSFYFASNRSGGFGAFDLYKGRIKSRVDDRRKKNSEITVEHLLDSLVMADTASVIQVDDSVHVVPPVNHFESDDSQPLTPAGSESDGRIGQFFLKEDQFVQKF
ncbi:MAG TPA: hypothetical protein VMV47_11175 [Bacteroidales bacterium]|nr:hypothetical protein [Bacteroidales bacterium]